MAPDRNPRVTGVNVHDVTAQDIQIEDAGGVTWLSLGRIVAVFADLDELAAIGREIVRQATEAQR